MGGFVDRAGDIGPLAPDWQGGSLQKGLLPTLFAVPRSGSNACSVRFDRRVLAVPVSQNECLLRPAYQTVGGVSTPCTLR